MKVVILAAGRGSRLGERSRQLPKLFVDVCGETIHQHLLVSIKELINRGIVDDEITIVLGYGFENNESRRDKLEKYIKSSPEINYNLVFLNDWNDVENAASALAGVESLDSGDDILLLCGDIIIESGELLKIAAEYRELHQREEYSAVVAFEGVQNDMTAVKWNNDNIITDYGAITGHQEAGIFILHRSHVEKAKSVWRENRSESWFPIFFSKIPSKPICIDKSKHFEINTPEHLEVAEEFLPFE